MTSLAYYSTIIKKEEILERISLDAERIASVANDLVCDIKISAAAAKSRDIETLLTTLDKTQEQIKVVSSMLDALKNNAESYVSFLIPEKQEIVKEEEALLEPKENKEAPKNSQDQILSLVESLKSLKDMQEKISK